MEAASLNPLAPLPAKVALLRLQPISKTSPRAGPARSLAGRRNLSKPLFGIA